MPIVPRVEFQYMGKTQCRIYACRSAEFQADFCLIGRRAFREDAHLLGVFELHFVCGLSWRPCSEALRMDRGTFFHRVYDVEHRLGKLYAETVPYALYPLDEYFGGTRRLTQPTPAKPSPIRPHALRPALRAAA